MANDFHPGAFQLACKDAAAAGVAESISFSNTDVEGFRCAVGRTCQGESMARSAMH